MESLATEQAIGQLHTTPIDRPSLAGFLTASQPSYAGPSATERDAPWPKEHPLHVL